MLQSEQQFHWDERHVTEESSRILINTIFQWVTGLIKVKGPDILMDIDSEYVNYSFVNSFLFQIKNIYVYIFCTTKFIILYIVLHTYNIQK